MPLLFSYGTLRQEAVQLSTFGRRLHGQPDELVGFEQGVLTVEDPEFVAKSGRRDHAVVRYDGRSGSRVAGAVFEVTDAELARADRYEPPGYRRVAAPLASGRLAWVYADARSAFVRPALASDAAAMADLTGQLGYDVDVRAVTRRLSRILARADRRVFAAESGGRVVGCLLAELVESLDSDPAVAIGGLVVDAQHRGTGIGRALMQHAEAWAREQGCSMVRLRSSATRRAAHRFYERLGYVNVKTQYTFARLLDGSGPEALNTLVPRVADETP